MVRRIIWTRRVQEDRKSIFKYWNKRNKSNIYSKNLNKIYVDAAELLTIHPKLGRKTNRKGIR